MSTMEQVKQNLVTADQSGPGTLSGEELAFYDRVREEYERLFPIPCTDLQVLPALPQWGEHSTGV